MYHIAILDDESDLENSTAVKTARFKVIYTKNNIKKKINTMQFDPISAFI